jgi:hypothetical protein
MVDPSRTKLFGTVEVDESYVGGRDIVKSRPPSLSSKKSIVAIAVEIKEKGFGRVRLTRIKDATQKSLNKFIRENVESGLIIRTDGSGVYQALNELGYIRDKHVLLDSKEPAH